MAEEKSADVVASDAPVPAAEPETRSLADAGAAVPQQPTPAAEPALDPLPSRPVGAAVSLPAVSVPAVEPEPEKAEPVVVLATVPAEKRGRGAVMTLLIAIAVLIVLAVIGYLVLQRVYADPTANAQAGDCLASLPQVDPGDDQEAPGARVVACSDAEATHQVEGRLNNQTADQARGTDICKDFPAATFIYRAVPESGDGYVLCLKKLTP